MAVTWFTSDTHFGHRGILAQRMGKPRPFPSIEAHDEALIARWNNRVCKHDRVFHLGDFAYGCSHAHARQVFERLNGVKFLVRGNHEEKGERLPWAAPPTEVLRVHVQDTEMERAQGVFLSHYAHRTWNHIWRGDIHLYGHSHGSLPGTARSLDVGVDCWEHRPVRLAEIQEALDENAAREAGDAVAAAMSAAA